MDKNDKKEANSRTGIGELGLYALLSFLLGGLVLVGAWWFYEGRIDELNFHWYHWIQPILIVFAGLLFLGAGVSYLRGSLKSGHELVKGGFTMVPVILALRLIIVLCVFAGKLLGWVSDGMSFEGFSWSRSGIWVTGVILLIIIAGKLLSKKNKA